MSTVSALTHRARVCAWYELVQKNVPLRSISHGTFLYGRGTTRLMMQNYTRMRLYGYGMCL